MIDFHFWVNYPFKFEGIAPCGDPRVNAYKQKNDCKSYSDLSESFVPQVESFCTSVFFGEALIDSSFLRAEWNRIPK